MAFSGRFPIGVGRQVELSRGADANVAVLGLGAALVCVATLGAAFVFGRPRRAQRFGSRRANPLASWLPRAGAPADLTVAANLSFAAGTGAKRAPSRAAITGGALLLATLVGVGVYVSSVDHLYANAAAHGWPWTAVIGNTNFPLDGSTSGRIQADSRFRHATLARYDSIGVNGQPVEVLAFDQHGTAPPRIVAGRLPRGQHEIAPGRRSLDTLGLHLGSTVRVATKDADTGRANPTRRMTVVGESVVPTWGDSDIGFAGVVPLDAFAAAGGDATPQLALVDVRAHGQPATVRSISHDYTEDLTTDYIPAHVVELHRARAVPLVGIAIAAIMGTFVFVYVLAVSVRRRTHELAVLRVLGMPPRRLSRVLAWQAALLAVPMLALGIPIGILAGTALWRRVAENLGIATRPTINAAYLAILALAVLVVALAASWYPARTARRQVIAQLLRTE